MKKNNLDRVKRLLLRSERIVLTTHVHPDGDGISAELALHRFLSAMGKTVRVVNRHPVPELFAFLPGVDKIEVGVELPPGVDLVVVLDCGGLERTGLAPAGEERPSVVVIDHHLTDDHEGDVRLLDADASATGELVYYVLRELEEVGETRIDHPTALCLYTSIFTDTGSFRYSNTTPEALAVASHLVSYGIDTWAVAEQVYESRSYGTLQLLARFLTTVGVSVRGRFAWGTIRQSFYQATGTREEHTDGFVNYARSIRGVEVALLFREEGEETVKVSMRSKGKVNVAALAETFGGGGHHNAAGCVLKGTLTEVRGNVLAAVAQALGDEVPRGWRTGVPG